MRKKICLILLIFFMSLFMLSFFNNFFNHKEDNSLKMSNFEDASIEDMATVGFVENENMTVGQCLTFLCRYKGYNVRNFDEVTFYAKKLGVLLPSEMIYSKEEWEELWVDIVHGTTLFEKVNDNTYMISLVPNYLNIYLNTQGYNFIKKGTIPPQLYFYSAYSDVSDLEAINLSKKATVGFVMDVLMTLKVEENKLDIVRPILIEKVKNLTGKEEQDWGSEEKAVYNYYALNYGGQYSYLAGNFGISDISFDDLNENLSVNDFVILFDKTF